MSLASVPRTIALTHLPSPQLEHGQRTHVIRTSVDYARACEQHAAYCQMLRDCGADVRVLNTNRDLPDSVFVEDTAIVLDEIAVMAAMGAGTRRAEITGVEQELQKHREVERITLPATIEGGDVLRVGQRLLVGVSSRTNRAGVEALNTIVSRHGYQVIPVSVRACLHLKTACTALPDETLLLNPAWVDVDALSGFASVEVAETEPWAANVALVGEIVCTASIHERTVAMIRKRGFVVHTVDISEFAKAEGGVTCLSLLFSAKES